MERKKILFVSTHHGARSRIAEEFAKQIAPEKIDAHSSCFDPRKISPLPIDIMREVGTDLPAESPKLIFNRRKKGDAFDYVISICDEVSNEQCPLFKRSIDVLYSKEAETIAWSIPDFKTLSGTEKELKTSAREIRDKIKSEVISFLEQIGINAEIA